MAVTPRSFSTAVNNAGVALPAGYVGASDAVLFAVGTTNATITPPTNVTEIISGDTPGGWNQRLFLATVALTGTQTFGTGGNYTDIWCVALIGVDLAAALGGTATNNTGTGTTATGLAVTAGRDGSLLLCAAVSDVGARSTNPSGMTAATGSPIDTNFYLDHQAVNTGSTGNKTSTLSSQGWLVQMVVFQPSASAPNVSRRRALLGVGA